MKYQVLCFMCKTPLRETRDIHESYAQGICITCSFKELLDVARKAQSVVEFDESHFAIRDALRTAVAQAEKVKL